MVKLLASLAQFNIFNQELYLPYYVNIIQAMVIKIKEPPIFGQSDNGSKNKTAGVVSDTDLSQFSFNRGIELIHVWEGKKVCSFVHFSTTDCGILLEKNPIQPRSDADFRPEEEGAFGIGRVQEVLETVRWPGLQCKPNPIGRSEHRRRLNDYVNEVVTVDNLQHLTVPFRLSTISNTGIFKTVNQKQKFIFIF
jgi:hypothetical protein